MSGTFQDDCPDGGGGRPTREQAQAVRARLQRLRPLGHISLQHVLDELTARNYVVSRATLGRLLPNPKSESPIRKSEQRVVHRRTNNKAAVGEKPKVAPAQMPPQIAEMAKTIESAIAKIDPRLSIEELTKKDQTSTMLAILENRERMALNIVLIRTMAMYPERMIADMRSTAALVDALTVAAKLSGGASIDITTGHNDEPAHNDAGNGAMKDVTPVVSPLAADFAKWRNLRKTNGQGA